MLAIPDQKLTALSFCEASVRDISAWVQALPMANTGETAKRLYHAIIELNQLIISPATRFQLLEVVRQPIYFVCTELSKHFLNQPVVLPEKQRKIANLAQALQLHLATGYKVVLLELQSQLPAEKIRKTAANACHRAISDLSRTVLRSCQLYCASPPSVWLEIHQLFRLAENHRLLNVDVRDEQNRHQPNSRIADAYKRVLLLGCSKPNQLRQSDIAAVYESFEAWSEHVDVGSGITPGALFIINMLKDAPPIYRSLHNGPVNEDYCGLDTSDLVNLLTEHLAQSHSSKKTSDGIISMPVRLADNLISHLSQALGILTKRTFKRLSSGGALYLCAGLSATHYYCSDGMDFNVQLVGDPRRRAPEDDDNIFTKRMKKADVWNSSFDAGPVRDGDGRAEMSPITYTGISNRVNSGGQSKDAFKQYRVPLVNTSPGGYCLQWNGEIPANIQAGEILGIREEESHPWSIAAIRWIRQVKQQGTQIGIELLAPSARPCGVQLINKTGESSEYLRGLLLPELATIGQPATLITPRLPFQTGHKILLNQMGQETRCQLLRRLSATGSFSQFELKVSTVGATLTTETKPTEARAEDEFDSLWPSL